MTRTDSPAPPADDNGPPHPAPGPAPGPTPGPTPEAAAEAAVALPPVAVATRLRSVAFGLAMALWTMLLGTVLLPMLLAPRPVVRVLIRFWARTVLAMLRGICGIRWTCPDTEALAALCRGEAQLLAVKHQSAWETIIFLTLLPDPCYVLKQELLRIPFYGWFTARAGMIAIDRSGGGTAMKQMLTAAGRAVARGRTVIIFPEGTRLPPGRHGSIHPGVVALHRHLDVPIIPVAHDSGLYWQKGTKRPGTIVLRVLPPILAGGDRRQTADRLAVTLFSATDALIRETIRDGIRDTSPGGGDSAARHGPAAAPDARSGLP